MSAAASPFRLCGCAAAALAGAAVLVLTGCGGDPSNYASSAGEVASAVGQATVVSAVAAAEPSASAAPGRSVAATLIIRRPPLDASVAEGGTAQFSVEADGARGITYQWLRDDEPIADETGSVLQLRASAADHLVHIRVLVSAPGASVRSPQAVLRVLPSPPTPG